MVALTGAEAREAIAAGEALSSQVEAAQKLEGSELEAVVASIKQVLRLKPSGIYGTLNLDCLKLTASWQVHTRSK